MEMAEAKGSAHLVGMFESPTVDTVVGRIQGTLGKPDNITCCKVARSDSLERCVPMQRFAGGLLVTDERPLLEVSTSTCLSPPLGRAGTKRPCM